MLSSSHGSDGQSEKGKRRGKKTDTIREITDRYEIGRTLRKTPSSEVVLAKHHELGKWRIIKAVSKQGKQNGPGGSAEALLLSGLSHPSIPVLYDFFENESTWWLVEEYIEGESLKDYLRRHHPTRKETAWILAGIADAVQYLHSLPVPILYQDLKPEHVILKGDRVVLIDYGICTHQGRSAGKQGNFGTEGYASPEQAEGRIPDLPTDIYSLGVVAREIVAARECGPDWHEKRLLRAALARDPEKRPKDILQWARAWDEKPAGSRKSTDLPARIAVVSNDHGTGTTHIAIALVVWLNHTGNNAFYDDCGAGTTERIRGNEDVFGEKEGIIYHGCFKGIAGCIPGRAEYEPPDGIRVSDCGTDAEKAAEADACILVIGTSLWKNSRIPAGLLRLPEVRIIMNPADRNAGRAVAAAAGRAVYGFPADEDPFAPSKDKGRVFEKLTEGWLHENIPGRATGDHRNRGNTKGRGVHTSCAGTGKLRMQKGKQAGNTGGI